MLSCNGSHGGGGVGEEEQTATPTQEQVCLHKGSLSCTSRQLHTGGPSELLTLWCFHLMCDGPSQDELEHSLQEVKMAEEPWHLEVGMGVKGLHREKPWGEAPALESSPLSSLPRGDETAFSVVGTYVARQQHYRAGPGDTCFVYVCHNQLSVLAALTAWTCHPMNHLKNYGISFRWQLRTLKVLMVLIRWRSTVFYYHFDLSQILTYNFLGNY